MYCAISFWLHGSESATISERSVVPSRLSAAGGKGEGAGGGTSPTARGGHEDAKGACRLAGPFGEQLSYAASFFALALAANSRFTLAAMESVSTLYVLAASRRTAVGLGIHLPVGKHLAAELMEVLTLGGGVVQTRYSIKK
jgi:hypothetical protein